MIFYHQVTQLLYRRVPKYHPIRKNPNKKQVLKIFKKRINNLKHIKIRSKQMIVANLLTINQKPFYLGE